MRHHCGLCQVPYNNKQDLYQRTADIDMHQLYVYVANVGRICVALTGQTESIAIVVADGGNGCVRIVLHHTEHVIRRRARRGFE